MVLGIETLLSLVKNKSLVTGLSDRELTNPEGCGFDLRLGKVHVLKGSGYLGEVERKTPDAKLVMEYKKGKKLVCVLKPKETILVTTFESVKMPKDVTGLLELRGTLYRSGVIMQGGNVAPGYEGTLSFMLYNSHTRSMKIEMGARIVHMLFLQVEGKGGNMYRGQWKGGRVVAKKLEKQV